MIPTLLTRTATRLPLILSTTLRPHSAPIPHRNQLSCVLASTFNPHQLRSFHTTPFHRSLAQYNIFLNAQGNTYIHKFTNSGFILSGELSLNGPILLMSNSAFLWDVPQPKDSNGSSLWDGWTEDMFKVFETVEPRPELLVIGTGKSFTPLPPHLRKYLLSLGIQLETIDTKNACSTYNVMLEEGRSVAAALLPIAPTSAKTGKVMSSIKDKK